MRCISPQREWKSVNFHLPGTSEVYAARDSYAAEHGYNLDQIYADLKRREAISDLRWSDSRPLAKA